MEKNKTLKILHLHVDYRWYDMVKSGIKTEEYRINKPYWVNRLTEIKYGKLLFSYRNGYEPIPFKHYDAVMYYRGYSKERMLLECKGISYDTGNTEWGAPKDEKVFVIKLGGELTLII